MSVSIRASQSPVRVITVFLVLTAILYAAGVWLIFRLGSATPLMLSVGLAAIVTCLVVRKDLRTLGWHWGSWRIQWQSYLLPLCYSALAYGFIWVFGIGGWYEVDFVSALKEDYNLTAWSDTAVILLRFLLTATVSFLLLLPSVLGEEIGWRGLLVPELSRLMSFAGVSLVSGLLWAIWHWPLIFMGLYGASDATPIFYQLACFTLCIMCMSVVITYFRFKTGSLWPAVVLHMSHNVFLQKFFGPMTSEYAGSAWFLGEFGIAVPAILMVLALYYGSLGCREFRGPKGPNLESV
ncbi:CPBP family intramembrane metalloprotease [Halioglobus maricola]|uniref:CPBP family intramembrane metalloprotease n=1 Tax=Halioglobus maricola TaxID=2601894 RepID=A0A5P9NQC5_9GAMM|nr:CPBP family intramembrane glutamic endopeptidase [Halioglobus maricola]QFU77058.1 CPBP family intramembrane metalloprotease [Halioglobus maricola]